jgi:hypothetical protein
MHHTRPVQALASGSPRRVSQALPSGQSQALRSVRRFPRVEAVAAGK